MIIFLYGPDAYRRERKRRELVEEFAQKHSLLSVVSFDLADEETTERFEGLVKAQSLFAATKLLVMRNVFGALDEKIMKIVGSLVGARDTIFLFSEDHTPPKEYSFLLKKPSFSLAFEHLRGVPWETFVRTEARKRALGLDDEATRFLAALYEGDTWRLITELEKLCSLGRTSLTYPDLAELNLEHSPDFWGLLNGLRSADRRVRFQNLERLLAMREPSAKIFYILTGQAGERAPLFARYDGSVKSGKLDYEEALLDSILL